MYAVLIACLRARLATETPLFRSALSILRNCVSSFPVRRTRFAVLMPAGRPRFGFGDDAIILSASEIMRRSLLNSSADKPIHFLRCGGLLVRQRVFRNYVYVVSGA